MFSAISGLKENYEKESYLLKSIHMRKEMQGIHFHKKEKTASRHAFS